jgi:hypothetical protein
MCGPYRVPFGRQIAEATRVYSALHHQLNIGLSLMMRSTAQMWSTGNLVRQAAATDEGVTRFHEAVEPGVQPTAGVSHYMQNPRLRSILKPPSHPYRAAESAKWRVADEAVILLSDSTSGRGHDLVPELLHIPGRGSDLPQLGQPIAS